MTRSKARTLALLTLIGGSALLTGCGSQCASATRTITRVLQPVVRNSTGTSRTPTSWMRTSGNRGNIVQVFVGDPRREDDRSRDTVGKDGDQDGELPTDDTSTRTETSEEEKAPVDETPDEQATTMEESPKEEAPADETPVEEDPAEQQGWIEWGAEKVGNGVEMVGDGISWGIKKIGQGASWLTTKVGNAISSL